MDIDKLRGELEIDEGICHHVYLDHLGYPTFGIGHLIVEGDPEYPGTEGEPVSPDRVIEAFEADLEGVLLDCKKLYVDFDELPEKVSELAQNTVRELLLEGAEVVDPIQNISPNNLVEVISKLQTFRQSLMKYDMQLADYVTLLANYEKARLNIMTEEEVEEEVTDESESG